MATVYDSYVASMDTQSPAYWSTPNYIWVGETFTAGSSYDIYGVILKLYRTGVVGDVTVSLRAVDVGTGKPTGVDLAVATIDGTTIIPAGTGIGDAEEVTFVFDEEYSLVSGTKYTIIIKHPENETTYVRWVLDSGDGYADGDAVYSDDAGVTWDLTTLATASFYFKTIGPTGATGAPVDRTYTRQLIAIANNEVWREATAGTMSEVTDANGDIDTTDVLNAAVSSQKLFIANGTNLKVVDFVNTKLYDADVLTTKPTRGQTIYQAGADAATMLVDFINGDASQDANYVYGKVLSGTFETGTGITTQVAGAGDAIMTPDTVTLPAAGPHWYDWTPYNNDETTYGSMPTKAYQVCRYRGRLQLSGDPNYPHQWYQSRQLNPFDFVYVPGDAQSPVAGNNADCSEVGDIVKVAIPYSDDYLIYGCANEIWVMSGDAAFGGELNPLDTTTGILGDRAWCWDDKGNLYMAGTAGLLRIPKGFGQIENLTRELWPDFIEDLAFDSSLHRITLAFDPEKVGIHIFKTTLADGVCSGWWYDLRTEGLFPDAIPTAMGIYSAVYYQTENPSYRKLLVGCADGYIKSFDKDTKNDDGTIITSYVGFAPLALSTHPRKDGIIKNIDIVTGIGDTDSDDVTCTVHVARTAAQVIKKLDDGDAASFTKVFIAPNWTKGNLDRRSIRGQWGAIVLTNSVLTESWSMERLIVDTKEIGRSI